MKVKSIRRGFGRAAKSLAAARDWRDAEHIALLVRCPHCQAPMAHTCDTPHRSAHASRLERALEAYPALAQAFERAAS